MNRVACLGVLLTFFVATVLGQVRLGGVPRSDGREGRAGPGEFTFVRTVYRSAYSGFRDGMWAVDFPEADYHFIIGVRDWSGTNLDISAEPEQLPILDERLFNYPLIYFVEPGFMELSQPEAEQLREYVSRGGFLFLDDFWGEYEWENVVEQMRK
ncbi:MAG TPA: DUF4159 domain-containing protein, partial [Blastocatellia bacterium]|nr:DUF4159 domain-containing protein [Blastocatellia bacterium]